MLKAHYIFEKMIIGKYIDVDFEDHQEGKAREVEIIYIL